MVVLWPKTIKLYIVFGHSFDRAERLAIYKCLHQEFKMGHETQPRKMAFVIDKGFF